MTDLRWPTKVKYVNTRDLTFRVAFNKSLRTSEASGASEDSELGLGDLSKLTTLLKSKFRSI